MGEERPCTAGPNPFRELIDFTEDEEPMDWSEIEAGFVLDPEEGRRGGGKPSNLRGYLDQCPVSHIRDRKGE